MKFTPLNKNILVKRIEEETTTSSGIIIPDSAKEKPSIATVEAIATGIKDVKVGDKILFSKYGGTEIPLDGQDYLILELENVLGIIS
jgi:chaperonin GroES